jgi:hypothetical protein
VNWGKRFDRFDLDDHFVFNNSIRSEPDLDPDALVNQRDRLLPDNAEPPPIQFIWENGFIDRFQ